MDGVRKAFQSPGWPRQLGCCHLYESSIAQNCSPETPSGLEREVQKIYSALDVGLLEQSEGQQAAETC